MGIRMLNRRPVSPRGRVGAGDVASGRAAPVVATAASTARIPLGLAAGLRGRLATVRSGLAGPDAWYLRATLLRGHLATALARLPRPARRARTLTVFVARPTSTASRPGGSSSS
ncbi:hypothetical protein AB0465_16015 [Streptomyces griseoviridis]|uniref:Uncharacterized protein n=2 Tax=Streptomyces griseoviridis TaxID=45398 RepID=A0A3S9ZJ69_STRGD|nr:hypothetical protein [Streptomyces griseoviridis]AZS87890.1 hypothetical protein ELQ87_29430 [Streptomyces griseoviridis]